MVRNEKGITLIGMLIMAVFLGMFALAAIKLLPVYLEYGKVQSTLQKVKTELDGKNPNPELIYRAVERRFDIEDVTRIYYKNVKVTRQPRSYLVQAKYEGRVYYIGNLYLVADFDTSVEIER